MAKIHLAFRFHINFYHSYRGDKPDETGFGKDIRIIRYILDVLDKYNRMGIPVRGTWDSENYFSLEKLIPQYCPDILERLQQRVNSGVDEMEIMSYNNGLVSSHTTEEFDLMMSKTLSNSAGSGLKDLFKEYAPIVRSQECMMTPALVPLYKKHGVEAITLFYSCIPFNGFSNFVPLLPLEQRFNPLWYKPEDDKIIVIPAVGVADVFDNLGIKAYMKYLRKQQLAMEEPQDLLVLVDMDADDDYWRGYFNTFLSEFILRDKEKLLWEGGLAHMIKQVKDLDYVVFDTPYNYLKSHPPIAEVSFTQDTADGSFDGLSPWSDKLDNAKLWSGIDRARTLCEYARAVAELAETDVEKEIAATLENRILTLSTTHFGLSTPVMCVPRLEVAAESVRKCVDESQSILKKAEKALQPDGIKAVFHKAFFNQSDKQGFIRIKIDEQLAKKPLAVFADGKELDSFIIKGFDGYELRAAVKTAEKVLNMEIKESKAAKKSNVSLTVSSIENAHVAVKADENGSLTLYYKDKAFTDKGSMDFWVEYNKKIVRCEQAEVTTEFVGGDTAVLTRKGAIDIGQKVSFTQKFLISGSLPYIYADVEAVYPRTPDYKPNKRKMRNLKRGWDTRWRQIAPLEIVPSFRGRDEQPVKIIKHNFFGKVSSFDLNYGTFSKNAEIDSLNNAVTAGWVAASNSEQGVLLAQSITADSNFAFARMRICKDKGKDSLKINPHGTYFGKQLHYPTRRHEIVGIVAESQAAQYEPLAPSYSGGHQMFSLMIAPFEGQPSEQLQNDAMLHAYPPHIVSSEKGFGNLELQNWSMEIIK